ncbi:MAG: acetyltransferase [Sphingomonadaceae bacterium PASS1]|nr:MAG: acetyltransferase [Sphingomonadaceae bacterium PASS1]
MPLLRWQMPDVSSSSMVFVDDNLAGKQVNGHAVLSFNDFVSSRAEDKAIALAVASPATREMVASRCIDAGLAFFNVSASNVIQMDNLVIGEGALLSPNVVLTSNILIGKHFHANIGSYVEHDCVLGDCVTFGPGVKCNGNVHIGDGAYIGGGAIIRQGRCGSPLRIGKGAVVGMGAIVLYDVPDGVTVVGNPATILPR